MDTARHDSPAQPFVRLTAEEEIELGRAWKEHGSALARDRLITSNLRLVTALAKPYMGKGVTLDELVAEGHLGLIAAVDHFDPGMGCRFSTYAAYWIRQSIARAFVQNTDRGRLGREDRQRVRQLEHAESTFFLEHGRKPTENEIAAVLSWTVERVHEARTLREAHTRQESLETPLEKTVSDHALQVASPSASDSKGSGAESGTTAGVESIAGHMDDLFAGLSDTEREIVELRFGVGVGTPHSISQIAFIRGQAEGTVRETLNAALSKLKRTARLSGLGEE